jgi:hypothetical protein
LYFIPDKAIDKTLRATLLKKIQSKKATRNKTLKTKGGIFTLTKVHYSQERGENAANKMHKNVNCTRTTNISNTTWKIMIINYAATQQ